MGVFSACLFKERSAHTQVTKGYIVLQIPKGALRTSRPSGGPETCCFDARYWMVESILNLYPIWLAEINCIGFQTPHI